MNKPRGFACMSAERRKAIASAGGKAAHKDGRAHQFNSQTAAVAGRKGGQSISRDRAHMSKIAKRGLAVRYSKQRNP